MQHTASSPKPRASSVLRPRAPPFAPSRALPSFAPVPTRFRRRRRVSGRRRVSRMVSGHLSDDRRDRPRRVVSRVASSRVASRRVARVVLHALFVIGLVMPRSRRVGEVARARVRGDRIARASEASTSCGQTVRRRGRSCIGTARGCDFEFDFEIDLARRRRRPTRGARHRRARWRRRRRRRRRARCRRDGARARRRERTRGRTRGRARRRTSGTRCAA